MIRRCPLKEDLQTLHRSSKITPAFRARITRRVSKACAALALGTIVAGSVMAAAPPAHAIEAQADDPRVTVLGWTNRTTEIPSASEFRADFMLRVPTGAKPAAMAYTWDYSNPNSWRGLTEIPDVQASVDQAYSIVQRQSDGGTDVLYISARGDAILPSISARTVYYPQIRITMPGGETIYQSIEVEDPDRSTSSGRPISVTPWDYSTTSTPGHPAGKNSQIGWGNVVAADAESTSVAGNQFYLDALNSRRSATTGCDATTEIVYQWVDQDGNRVGEQKSTKTPNHAGGLKGKYLSDAQTFDAPGYYRLMSWPQASSTSTTAPTGCQGVSYDPAVLSEGTQVGSVFYKLPSSVNEIASVVLTRPAFDGTVDTSTPTFAGTGQPGAALVVVEHDGTRIAGATVEEDGTWTATSEISLLPGRHTGTVTQTSGGHTSTADFQFTVAPCIASVALTSPALDSTVRTPMPTFTGTGQPGADIEVTSVDGVTLTTATVREDGTWSATSKIPLAPGKNAGTVTQKSGVHTSTADFRFTMAPPCPC